MGAPEYLQIRLLNSKGGLNFTLQRAITSNCYLECSVGRFQSLFNQSYEAGYIICYVMISSSNGAQVAQGAEGNFTLVPPFNETSSGFNCSGIRLDKAINAYFLY